MKKRILLAASLLFSAASSSLVSAHCQIPCGIYADDNVFVTMHKDQETIAKAMKQIAELSKDPTKNANQLVRWVNNKEQHAQSIQDTVAEYFLAQRIKIDEADRDAYQKKLTLLHQITVYAMKCKQTDDPENAQKLHDLIGEFNKAYAGKSAEAAKH
ncbi:superoxide dismutase [Ni] [Rubritalea spongiae]|uniref:Superoxide dismutase [Ni] n=1 Tax=Rubritalea spongiae TaxID=430797 RepID=A0ABW5E0Y9_9BACT